MDPERVSAKKQWKIVFGLIGLGACMLLFVLVGLAFLPAETANELLPFADWKPLPAPPERVVALMDANPAYLYVKTASGNMYRCQLSLLQNCWKQTRAPVVGQDGWYSAMHVKGSSKVPRNAISTLAIETYTGDYTKTKRDFALMPDGSILLYTQVIDAFSFLPPAIVGFACVVVFLLLLLVYAAVTLGVKLLWRVA